MSVDQTSLERIRNATFPASRRGYDKREVEKFLNRLADWLETGGGDQARSDTVKKELERVGERTGSILAQAEESAQAIRSEAEQEAQATTEDAKTSAEESRKEADDYSSETRGAADQYAEQTRSDGDAHAESVRSKADQDASEQLEAAKQQAERIVQEGVNRRNDIEAVISDLVSRRDAVIVQTEELAGQLSSAVADHKPSGEDQFDTPDELDPGADEGEEPEAAGEDDEEGPEPESGDTEADEAEEQTDRRKRSRKRAGGSEVKA